MIHNISPIAFGFGPLEVRFYSLMFAGGLVSAYLLLRWIWRREGWVADDLDSLVIYLFIGLVVGARLGEVLFYHPGYYFSQPLEIFKIWKGGLASHGATIGLLVSYLAFLWGKGAREGKAGGGGGLAVRFAARWATVKRDFWKYIDGLAVAIPLVAGFVRMGNFFNSEIVGRVTESWAGVVFLRNGENFARHPVQLYEGLWVWLVFVAGLILWVWGRGLGKSKLSQAKKEKLGLGWWKSLIREKGFFLFFFVGFYFAGRFGLEFFKEYQVLSADNFWGLTMGQWLSVLPIVLAGWWFFTRAKARNSRLPEHFESF